MTRQELVDQLKDGLIFGTTNAVMAYLQAQVPFFNLPLIRTLTKMAVEKIVSIIVNYTELGAYFVYVDWQTNAQVKDFEEAARLNKESPTDENRQKLIDAARKLISFK